MEVGEEVEEEDGGLEGQSVCVVMVDVRVGEVVERVKINELKGKVDVSTAEGRLSEDEGSERWEGMEGSGRFVDDVSVGHRCFGWGCRCRQGGLCVS